MSIKKKNRAEKKNSPHFNAVDALIVILAIIAVVGVYFRYNILDFLSSSRNNEEYVVSFSIENIRYTTPNYINVGDNVYLSSDGELLGVLMSESENQGALNITPASEFFTDSSGKVVEAFYPSENSRVDAKGRMLCEGVYDSEGGFSVSGKTHLAPGQTLSVYTEKVTFSIVITEIEIYEE
ncbi:MAG: hypothetical protein E7641_06040 [Ruminococcaceae bacterium]|nr:hypothetical protein [Oscillospiraceae bacterium]